FATTFFGADFFAFSVATFFDAALDLVFAVTFLPVAIVVSFRRVQSMWPIYFLRTALCGLSLPMRPLSVPAAGSITALMRVGLPEPMAAWPGPLSSPGVVA